MFTELKPLIKDSFQLKEAGLDLPVISVKPIIVYYLYNSRQVYGYEYGYGTHLFFSNLKLAKDKAESLRERGSSFYIEQKPALYFYGNENILLAAELDEIKPFSHISITSSRSKGVPLPVLIQSTWIALKNMSFRQVIQYLSHETESLHSYYRERLIFRYGVKHEMQLEKLEKSSLEAWRSVSTGGCYPLTWYTTDNKTDISSVVKFTTAFGKATTS